MTNLEIIKECLDQIPAASLEYHDWLKIGSAIKHEGGTVDLWDAWSRTDAKRYKPDDFRRRWAGLDKGSSPVTVASVCRICYEHGGTPPHSGGWLPDGVNADDPIPLDGLVTLPDSGNMRIIRTDWLEIANLPPDDGKTGVQQLAEYLRTLFQPEDYVGFVAVAYQSEPDKDGKRRWLPGKGVYSNTAGELLNRIAKSNGNMAEVIGDTEESAGAWIRFNPLDGKGVSDSNVTQYRYALVESDTVDINQQYTIIRKLELPVAAMVLSGGKSLHAIVRIDASDYKEYQKRVDSLYDICRKNGLTIDRSNKNPSRLSRMPGVMRNGNMQRLVCTNTGKESWGEWIDWIAAQNDDLPEVESLSSVWDRLPPLQDCLIEGILRKGHKMLVSGPSKAGKSFLLLELVVAIAEGGTWLSWQCRQGRVLYVNLELDRASCLHRLKDIYMVSSALSPADSIRNIDIWNLRGKAVPMDDLAPRLIRRAAKKQYAAVIIDPIYKVITGDENSADQMAKFCNQFDKVCNELQCAVIYCHHHSKGDQGQKRAQDRASGSGVFARDPDALIDMVELEIDDKRREQILYKYKVKALQELLDRTSPHWRDDMDMEDAEKLEVVIEKARSASPEADRVNADAHYAALSMTGWRIGGILREFPVFPDQYAFFRYPVHLCGDLESSLLMDCHPAGELPYQPPMTKAERADAGRRAAKEKKDTTVTETVMAFQALDDGTPVTTKRVAEYLDIHENNASKRLKAAGFVHPDGVKGVWIKKED